ncbi:hypothetical protein R1sor_020685 [Riccia sorocarpa]|uniref:Uncharacterized protein n=1 Tax=Riccia sorocarpa TaxID=122646 RepID=A0ABD3GH04_9MARC
MKRIRKTAEEYTRRGPALVEFGRGVSVGQEQELSGREELTDASGAAGNFLTGRVEDRSTSPFGFLFVPSSSGPVSGLYMLLDAWVDEQSVNDCQSNIDPVFDMAQQGGASGLKLLIVVLALGFAAYICGPPLYWHFVGDGAGKQVSLPVCICDSSNDSDSLAGPGIRSKEQAKAVLSMPSGLLISYSRFVLCRRPMLMLFAVLDWDVYTDLANITLPDCARDDPDMQDELGKSRYQLLQEELKLQETVAEEAQQRSEAAILEAKKTASQFQKEFEKCNLGMETSEGAREKAEAALVLAKKNSELWEGRARELGWKDDTEKTEEIHEKADNIDTTEQTVENIENREDGEVDDSRPDARKLQAATDELPSRSSVLVSKARREILSKTSRQASS